MNLDHLDWPFFDDAHQSLATGLGIWGFRGLLGQRYVATRHAALVDDAEPWWLPIAPAAYGGERRARLACAAAAGTLVHADGLPISCLRCRPGSGPITLAGSPAQKRWLPAVAKAKAIAAFALSEPGAARCRASTRRRDGDSW